jgi:hypothetical protein
MPRHVTGESRALMAERSFLPLHLGTDARRISSSSPFSVFLNTLANAELGDLADQLEAAAG